MLYVSIAGTDFFLIVSINVIRVIHSKSPPSFWQKSKKAINGCTGKNPLNLPPSFLKIRPKGGGLE